jgi:hypothetical protein
MDRRVYILPVASVLLLAILLIRPDITGLMTAKPSAGAREVSAKISVAIAKEGFIPEDSSVAVYLDGRNASMKFGDFVALTGAGYSRVRERIPQINYEGYGYGGEYAYVLDISEFGLDTSVEPGNHELNIQVIYNGSVKSNTSQNIET